MPSSALILLLVLPFFGAIVAPFIRAAALARTWAVLVSVATLAVAAMTFINAPAGEQFYLPKLEIAELGFAVRLAMDGISVWLVLLTCLVTPLAVLATEKRIAEQPGANSYYAWILMLLGALLGTFLAADGLLFYFFFELTLVPSILLIGLWGGPDRKSAATKFFIYTFAGSVFMLIGLIYLRAHAQSFEIRQLVIAAQAMGSKRVWVALAFLIGFLIKTPVFPLHTWQPLAYAEAPTSTTVILAAVLSKLGTYGLIRLTLPIGFVTDSITGYSWVNDLVTILCLIGIVYGGLIAWVQKDMVRLMAYSSLSHLGLCVLAIFAGSTLSLQGAVAYMVAHGLATAGVLMCISMIASRTRTRDLKEMSGLFAKTPVVSTLLVFFTVASIGLPITSGFVGEFLSLQGVMNHYGLGVTIVAATGMVLGAIYMLHMVAKVGFGPLKAPEGADLSDITARETGALLPLIAAVLLMGILPTPMLNSFKSDVQRIATEIPVVNDQPLLSEDALIAQPAGALQK